MSDHLEQLNEAISKTISSRIEEYHLRYGRPSVETIRRWRREARSKLIMEKHQLRLPFPNEEEEQQQLQLPFLDD